MKLKLLILLLIFGFTGCDFPTIFSTNPADYIFEPGTSRTFEGSGETTITDRGIDQISTQLKLDDLNATQINTFNDGAIKNERIQIPGGLGCAIIRSKNPNDCPTDKYYCEGAKYIVRCVVPPQYNNNAKFAFQIRVRGTEEENRTTGGAAVIDTSPILSKSIIENPPEPEPPPPPPPPDADSDGILDVQDNCPAVVNADQVNQDNDGFGDACDECPAAAGPLGIACPTSDDSGSEGDNSPDRDKDSDSIKNGVDNCPEAPNANQADLDEDAIGDACDPDKDGDGINEKKEDGTPLDNCPELANADQLDDDADGTGDACDTYWGHDYDKDGVVNEEDNCSSEENPEQEDGDEDGVGDVCDICPDQNKDTPLEDDSAGTTSTSIFGRQGCPFRRNPFSKGTDSGDDETRREGAYLTNGCSLNPSARPDLLFLFFFGLGLPALWIQRKPRL